jgi:uncharacterized protein YkwD
MKFLRGSVVLCLALVSQVLMAQTRPARWLQSGKQEVLQPEAEQVFALANRARAQAGSGPLRWDSALAAAARRHCLRMAAEGPISHQYEGEPDLSERANQAGAHFSLIEENVAVGPTPAAVHDEWMHSPGHRSNLLNPDVDRVGVALVASRGVLYAVADYERAVPVLALSQVEATVAGLLQARGVNVLDDAMAARGACVMNRGLPSLKSGPQPRFVMRWQDADLSHLPQVLLDRLATGRFRQAAVGSCSPQGQEGAFTAYRVAVLLY